MTVQLPGFDPSYIFRILSDFWDTYKERDQLATIWGGLSQITDDLYLQNYQADFSKSLETVPVYWRYSWVYFELEDWEASTDETYIWKHPIDSNIVSAPVLQDAIDLPASTFEQGVDHVITSGWIFSKTAFTSVWAPNLWVDEKTINNNFGEPIGFSKATSSVDYLYSTRGIWYVYWNGPSVTNIRRGAKIAIDIPLSPADTRVLSITPNPDNSNDIQVQFGDMVFNIPYPLLPIVSAGEQLTAYQELSDGVQVWDYINKPDWWQYIPGFQKIWRRFSVTGGEWVGRFDDRGNLDDGGHFDDSGEEQDVSKDIYELIKHFTWILLVDGSQVKIAADAADLIKFADTIKPAYTDYIPIIENKVSEEIVFGESVLLELEPVPPYYGP